MLCVEHFIADCPHDEPVYDTGNGISSCIYLDSVFPDAPLHWSGFNLATEINYCETNSSVTRKAYFSGHTEVHPNVTHSHLLELQTHQKFLHLVQAGLLEAPRTYVL